MPDYDHFDYYGQLKLPGDSFLSNANGNVDDQGVWTIMQRKYCFWSDLHLMVPIFGSGHPEFASLLAQGSTFEQLDGDYCVITTPYKGAMGSGYTERAEPTYTTRVNQATEPIETHPQFSKIKKFVTDTYGEDAVTKDDNGRFVKFNDRAGEFAGVTSYLTGYLNYTYSVTLTSPINRFSRLYKLDTPMGSAPGGARDWLFVDMQEQRQGNVYQYSLSWMAGNIRGQQRMIYE